MDDVFAGVGSSLGLSFSVGSTGVGKFYQNIQKLGVGLTDLKLASIGKSIQQLGVGAMFSVIQKAIDLAFEIDSLGRKFQAATGYTNDFSNSMLSVYQNTVKAGASTDDVSKAFGSLSSNLSSFSPTADDLNERLATSLTLMEKIGIESSEAAKLMNTFQRALKVSADDANYMTLQLATMGSSIGIETKKMMSDLSSAMPNLLQFGNRAEEVFTGLAAKAKAAGLEMSKLISVAEKFDTFDDAADNTAKLNAMLGTNISAMEMLTADYDEKLSILRNQIGAAVGDLSKMDRFTQLFVKDALGVGSVAEAQQLLNMSTQEYLSFEAKMQSQAKTQAQLAEQAAELVVPMEQLKIVFMKFAASLTPVFLGLLPIIEGLATLVDIILNNGVVQLIGLLTLAVYGFGYATEKAAIANARMMGSIALLVIGFQFMASQETHMQALGALILGLAAYLAILNVTVESGTKRWTMLAMAFASILAIFKTRINPLFINAFIHMAIGLRLMISAMNTAGPQVLIFAAGFLLMGVGLAIVIYAFKELLSVAFQFFELAVNNHDKLFLVAGGIAAIALAINFLSISMLAGLTIAVIYFSTMGVFIASMLATGLFGGGNLSFDMEGLVAFGNAMKMIGAGMTQYVKGLAQIATITSQVKASIGSGLFAATVEGGKTSVVMAGEGTLKAISASKIEVDVNIPEIKVPQPIVHVYIDGKEIDKRVKEGIVG